MRPPAPKTPRHDRDPPLLIPALAIGVPARNEVERLPRLLDALARQAAAPPFTLCLFLDDCDDGSAELVARLSATLPFPVLVDCDRADGPPNAGRARRRAMALALATAPGGILLTTDADGEPAPDWIVASLAGLRAADIVAGRVVRGPGAPSPKQDRVEAYQDRLHALRRRLDPVAWEADRSHGWTSAASLALPAAVYRALGGFPPLANGEDAALCDAAARAGYRIRRDADAVVCTSARRHGRADRGFAAALAALDGTDALPLVVHPADEAWRFALQARARAAHGGDLRPLAADLRLGEEELTRVAAECRNGEAFAARIVGAPPTGMRHVNLAHAELLLAACEQGRLEGAA